MKWRPAHFHFHWIEHTLLGMASGLYAGALMLLAAIGQAHRAGFNTSYILQEIAAVIYGLEALIRGSSAITAGLVVHGLMSLFLGAVFMWIFGRVRSRFLLVFWAVVYGIVAWGIATFLLLPFVNPVMAERIHLLRHAWFFDHLAFGGALGLAMLTARAFRPLRPIRTVAHPDPSIDPSAGEPPADDLGHVGPAFPR